MKIGRVAFVAPRTEMSGAITYAEHLARGLRRGGAVIRMVTPGGRLDQRFESVGVEVERHSYMNVRVLGRFSATSAAARMLGFMPDVVHALTPDAWRTARVIARAARVPLIVTAHDFVDSRGELPWAAGEWPRVLAISEALRENLVNVGGIPKTAVRVTPVGLDLDVYPAPPPAKEPGTGETKVSATATRALREGAAGRVATIACVARLVESQGVDCLLRALGAIIERGVDAELFVLGTGPMENALRRLACQIGIANRVTFIGDGMMSEQLLPNVSLAVLPANREALGTAVLEAMACSRPVVASGVGGVFNLVQDGRTGYLVPPGDARALAEKICALALDRPRAEDMGRAGREKIEKEFPLNAMVRATLDAYVEARGDILP